MSSLSQQMFPLGFLVAVAAGQPNNKTKNIRTADIRKSSSCDGRPPDLPEETRLRSDGEESINHRLIVGDSLIVGTRALYW